MNFSGASDDAWVCDETWYLTLPGCTTVFRYRLSFWKVGCWSLSNYCSLGCPEGDLQPLGVLIWITSRSVKLWFGSITVGIGGSAQPMPAQPACYAFSSIPREPVCSPRRLSRDSVRNFTFRYEFSSSTALRGYGDPPMPRFPTSTRHIRELGCRPTSLCEVIWLTNQISNTFGHAKSGATEFGYEIIFVHPFLMFVASVKKTAGL
jgi:hypothetical protein